MRKVVAIMVVALAALCLAGPAWSWDLGEHVTYGTNNKGDVLIFPVNPVLEGWDSKIVVINTSRDYSVVAKVVVRSEAFSIELLDFLIFLSPTDVWVGYLQFGPDGPEMYSEDDSVQTDDGTFASPLNPMRVVLVRPVCEPDYQFVSVEVIESWACGEYWNSGDALPGQPNLGGPSADLGLPPVPKESIHDAYFSAPWGDGICDFDEDTQNVLGGHYEVSVMPIATAADSPTFLKDYDVETRLTIFNETKLGVDNARNNICEVDAVLAKDRIYSYYYANDSPDLSFHWEFFPTKYTTINTSCQAVGVAPGGFWDYQWTNMTEGTVFIDPWICLEFGLRYWDLSEKTPSVDLIYSPIPDEEKRFKCWEINLVAPFATPWDFIYDEGWAEYRFEYSTSCVTAAHVEPVPGAMGNVQYVNFNGVPEIPVVWFIKGIAGFSIHTPGWDDALVEYYDGACDPPLMGVPFAVPQYHVWEGTDWPFWPCP